MEQLPGIEPGSTGQPDTVLVPEELVYNNKPPDNDTGNFHAIW